MEEKLKHLEFIQLTITRMAANSFFVKGWSVTLISALAVLAQKDSNSNFWLVAAIPAVTFWGLDAYFLRQEKLFRKLYDSVRNNTSGVDFSLDIGRFETQVPSWFKVVFSKIILAFHLTIIFAVGAIAFLLRGNSRRVEEHPKPQSIVITIATPAPPTMKKNVYHVSPRPIARMSIPNGQR